MPKIKFICGLENISLSRFSALVWLGAAKEKKRMAFYILLEYVQKRGKENGLGGM